MPIFFEIWWVCVCECVPRVRAYVLESSCAHVYVCVNTNWLFLCCLLVLCSLFVFVGYQFLNRGLFAYVCVYVYVVCICMCLYTILSSACGFQGEIQLYVFRMNIYICEEMSSRVFVCNIWTCIHLFRALLCYLSGSCLWFLSLLYVVSLSCMWFSHHPGMFIDVVVLRTLSSSWSGSEGVRRDRSSI